MVLQTGHDLADGSWHRVDFKYGVNEISLGVDYAWPDTIILDEDIAPSLIFEPDSDIVIGIGYYDTEPGKRSIKTHRKKFEALEEYSKALILLNKSFVSCNTSRSNVYFIYNKWLCRCRIYWLHAGTENKRQENGPTCALIIWDNS